MPSGASASRDSRKDMTRHLRRFSIGEGSGFRDAAQSCIVARAARRRHFGEKAMRFGWLTLSLSPSPDEDAARIDQQLAQIRAAEGLGFGDVWLTEHYF